MSVSTEIDRLQLAADGIRGKMMELGAAESGDNLTTLSQKITVLEKPNGNKGQVVGFVENNEIGAMDAPSGTGGGAIPAYIVGDTMLSGWLSETENGTALTPVDKQEYVILTSGEWLRKHVMWVADLGVYRLTGKVETADEVLDSYIIGQTESDSTLTGVIGAPRHNDILFRELTITRGMKQIVVSGSGRPETQTFTNTANYVYLKKDGETIITAPNWSTSNIWVQPFPTGTIELSPEDEGKKLEWWYHRKDDRIDIHYTINLHIVTNTIFDDYETDDVIDITESEIETIWGETAGAADPTNNVFSTEERLWGYWIDGKPIYRKTVSCGALPNATTKMVAHGISNLYRVVNLEGYIGNYQWQSGLFYNTGGQQSGGIAIGADSTNITFQNTLNMSWATESYVTLYYTKTT